MIGWQVERARHVILLREKLQQQQQQQQRNGGAELSKLDKDALNNTLRPRHVTGSSANQLLSDKERERSSTDVEKSPVDERKGLDSVASVDRSTALDWLRPLDTPTGGVDRSTVLDWPRPLATPTGGVDRSTALDWTRPLDTPTGGVDRSTALVVRCLKLMLYNRTEARDRLLAAVRPTARTALTCLPISMQRVFPDIISFSPSTRH